MAMRLRRVGNRLIAVCAALTEPKEGDVYLDDGQHYAIAMKYYHEAGMDVGEYAELMEREQDYRDAAAETEAWSAAQTAAPTEALNEIENYLTDRDGNCIACGRPHRSRGHESLCPVFLVSAALRTQEPREEWRPIETAPKDGTRVLLFCRYGVDGWHNTFIAQWIDGDELEPAGWWENIEDKFSLKANFTHWMPLPAPPEAPYE